MKGPLDTVHRRYLEGTLNFRGVGVVVGSAPLLHPVGGALISVTPENPPAFRRD
ncbi:hypothetical protein JOF56_000304 [Kibdelosporangium banguiense]|uniref:Uncharacterized protein n=1 Tax=Kibdelosporangium banguiense TaxID=1365924 RepID=A0ABS4T627_9PSEU|nr:hypothetical protein [Kibdelosporangium banguiense]